MLRQLDPIAPYGLSRHGWEGLTLIAYRTAMKGPGPLTCWHEAKVSLRSTSTA